MPNPRSPRGPRTTMPGVRDARRAVGRVGAHHEHDRALGEPRAPRPRRRRRATTSSAEPPERQPRAREPRDGPARGAHERPRPPGCTSSPRGARAAPRRPRSTSAIQPFATFAGIHCERTSWLRAASEGGPAAVAHVVERERRLRGARTRSPARPRSRRRSCSRRRRGGSAGRDPGPSPSPSGEARYGAPTRARRRLRGAAATGGRGGGTARRGPRARGGRRAAASTAPERRSGRARARKAPGVPGPGAGPGAACHDAAAPWASRGPPLLALALLVPVRSRAAAPRRTLAVAAAANLRPDARRAGARLRGRAAGRRGARHVRRVRHAPRADRAGAPFDVFFSADRDYAARGSSTRGSRSARWSTPSAGSPCGSRTARPLDVARDGLAALAAPRRCAASRSRTPRSRRTGAPPRRRCAPRGSTRRSGRSSSSARASRRRRSSRSAAPRTRRSCRARSRSLPALAAAAVPSPSTRRTRPSSSRPSVLARARDPALARAFLAFVRGEKGGRSSRRRGTVCPDGRRRAPAEPLARDPHHRDPARGRGARRAVARHLALPAQVPRRGGRGAPARAAADGARLLPALRARAAEPARARLGGGLRQPLPVLVRRAARRLRPLQPALRRAADRGGARGGGPAPRRGVAHARRVPRSPRSSA